MIDPVLEKYYQDYAAALCDDIRRQQKIAAKYYRLAEKRKKKIKKLKAKAKKAYKKGRYL
jgi:hypothetical protein